jgi:hypothetical protein
MKKVFTIITLSVLVSCQQQKTCSCVGSQPGAPETNVKYTFEGTPNETAKQCENLELSQKPSWELNNGNYTCEIEN